MTIMMPTIRSPKLNSLLRQIRPIERADFDMLVEGQGDYVVADKLHTFVEEVRKAIASIEESLNELYSGAAGSLSVAMARVTVVPEILSTRDVENDVVHCVSSTDVEFDFTDGRRFTTAVLSPGRGVAPLTLRFDKIIQTGETGAHARYVYAIDSTKLQLIRWDGNEWIGMPWDIGWTIDIVQLVPSMFEILPTGE